jgi:acetylornithine deacetylase
MRDRETLELAQQLVRIDSVNPSLVPGASGEGEIANFIRDFLQGRGIDAQLSEAQPGRPNVVARIPGETGSPRLLLCGHMDTVSVEGMEEPFSGRIEDGRLIGRGAQDVKGGLAALLAAGVVYAQGSERPLELFLAAVADEEAYSTGTEALLASGLQADAAVVFEPTELEVAVAHKGFAWARIETQGVAAHGSRPSEGVDAIAHMGRVLSRIEVLGETLRTGTSHPRLGPPSVHASRVGGGRELSSYPDHCWLDVERRTLPGETRDAVERELADLLSELSREDDAFRARGEITFYRPAFEIGEDEPLPRAVAGAIARVVGEARFAGMTGWTDSALLGAAGIPTVVLGPGGSGLHGTNEYGDVVQICQCRDVLIELTKRPIV